MRKSEIQEITQKVDVTTDILCNKCGKSCRNKDSDTAGSNFHDYCGLLEISVFGGFYSPKLGDGTEFRFSLCEFCIDKMFDEFEIEPEIL